MLVAQNLVSLPATNTTRPAFFPVGLVHSALTLQVPSVRQPPLLSASFGKRIHAATLQGSLGNHIAIPAMATHLHAHKNMPIVALLRYRADCRISHTYHLECLSKTGTHLPYVRQAVSSGLDLRCVVIAEDTVVWSTLVEVCIGHQVTAEQAGGIQLLRIYNK